MDCADVDPDEWRFADVVPGLDAAVFDRFRKFDHRVICARATRLRNFAGADGSVDKGAWRRIGGHPCVREAALRVLAARPVTRRQSGYPVRLGLERASAYARRWAEDIGPA